MNEYRKAVDDGTSRRRRSVALVGMDGSGKSTQARLLRERLSAEAKWVLVIHPFGRKLLAFLPEQLTSEPAGARPHEQGRRPGLKARLSAIAELLDIGIYISLAYLRSSLMSVLGGAIGKREVWLVSDRSFDDLLIKHQRRGTLPAALLKAVRSWAPVPEKTIWLETPPSLALARDGEFGAAYYEQLYVAYAAGARRYGWEVVPTAGCTPEQVNAHVERLLGLRAETLPPDAGQPAQDPSLPVAPEIIETRPAAARQPAPPDSPLQVAPKTSETKPAAAGASEVEHA